MFVIDQSFIKNKRAAFFTENSPSKHDMVSTLRVDATLYYILLLHFYAISTRASARDATIGLAAPIVLIRVSTHASARDATLRRFTRGKAFVVSTHASARDATLYAQQSYQYVLCFNSRVREGRDHNGIILVI